MSNSFFAVQAHVCYIYIRGEILLMDKNFKLQLMKLMKKLIEKMQLEQDGIWIFTSIMEQEHTFVVRKQLCLRVLKVRPAKIKTTFSCINRPLWLSTIINNAETIAVVQQYLEEAVNGLLPLEEKNTGTKIFCISGNVNSPCNVEEEMNIP